MTVLKPLWLQSGSHPALDVRLAMSAMLGVPTTTLTRSGGVLPGYAGGLAVTQAGSPSMNVVVAAGAVLVPGTTSSSQGAYLVVNDASVTLPIAAAHASLARIDVVVMRIRDQSYGDGSSAAALEIVTGTAAGSPVAPAIPANSIKLYDVAVAASDTTIVNGDLTDRRLWAVGLGGIHPCLSTAQPANPYTGMAIYETNTGLTKLWNGSAWARGGARTWAVSTLGPGGGENQTATVYEDLAPSVTLAIVKSYSGSDLLVNLSTSVYVSGTSADAYFSVQINGTDYTVAQYSNNVIDAAHVPFSGSALVSGIPAGSYTATVRWKRGAGTGTLNRNSFDPLYCTIQEVN